MNQIMIGYKRSAWALHVGVFNAFVRDYRMVTQNLSALTPYTSSAHSGGSSSYLAVKVNISLGFGRSGRRVDIPQSEDDNNSEIMTGNK